MKKRVVSLLLALLLVLGLVPGAAAIETGADWDPDVEVDPDGRHANRDAGGGRHGG